MNDDYVDNSPISEKLNIRLPFRTKCGWPARLVGVLQRTAFPYVVAVWNPAFNAEELHTYGEDGLQPVNGNYDHDKGVEGGMLSLVNIGYDEWRRISRDTMLHAYVVELPSYPPKCNPFLHDHFRMGTALVRGWMAMHDGFDSKDNPRPLKCIELVNTDTGQRFSVHFNPVDKIEVSHKMSQDKEKEKVDEG